MTFTYKRLKDSMMNLALRILVSLVLDGMIRSFYNTLLLHIGRRYIGDTN